jgi:hypothetical protein
MSLRSLNPAIGIEHTRRVHEDDDRVQCMSPDVIDRRRRASGRESPTVMSWSGGFVEATQMTGS